MSSYLKKSKGSSSSSKCLETSSHETNSTRSTTNSTLPPDDANFFPSKNNDFSSKKSSSNSGSSDSANFEFGNGLEFGQGFDSSGGFGDDGFGVRKQDRKAELPSLFSAAQDPFKAASAPKSMRNFGATSSSSGFDSFEAPPVAQSMRNCGATSDGFGSFDAPPVPQSMRNFGSTGKGFDDFGSSDPFKNVDDKGFASFEHEENLNFRDDGFGTDPFAPPAQDSAWEKREKWKNETRSKSGDVPKRSGGERRKVGTLRRFNSTDNLRLTEPVDAPSPSVSVSSRKKPASSKHLNLSEPSSHSQRSSDKSPRQGERKSSVGSPGPVRRTRSGVRPSRRGSVDQSGHTHESESANQSSESQPRQRPPRRGSLGMTTSDGPHQSESTSQSSESQPRQRPPRRGSLGITSSDGPHQSESTNQSSESQPRQRPPRRGSLGMTTSDGPHQSESTNQSSESQPRRHPPRRGSLGITTSDGNLEPATLSRMTPSRNKSASGPAHRPAGGRRQRRSELNEGSSGKLDFMQINLPSAERQDDSTVEDDGNKEDNDKKVPITPKQETRQREGRRSIHRTHR
jgi:hypothetical protein